MSTDSASTGSKEIDGLIKRAARDWHDGEAELDARVSALTQAIARLVQQRDAVQTELDAMRLLAGDAMSLPKVRAALGPLSLWTQSGLNAMIELRVAEALARASE
jgi:hypothetical protein